MTTDPTDARSEESRIGRLRRRQEVEDRVELLSDAPLFSVLHPMDLRTLATKFHPLRCRKGEMVFRENEPGERLFVIAKGSVKLTTASARGAELLIAVLGAGQIFGELSVIDRGLRAMSARAMQDSVLYALPSDTFWTMLENRPALARRLLELMARRLRRADQASQDLVFFDAPTRLARKLVDLAEEHGVPVGDEDAVRLSIKVTQEEMAQMIGVTRSSANRLIANFVDRGWLDWNDGSPILRHPESLLRRAR